MSTPEIVVHGSVRPDGALELDEKLPLPPGRVKITVQPVVEPAGLQEDWWQCLQRARAELELRDAGFRTQEEIEAEREAFRSGDERVTEVHEDLEGEHPRQEQNGC
jgi:hypothetical protein